MSKKDYTRYSNQPANHEKSQNGVQNPVREPASAKQEEPVKSATPAEPVKTAKPEPVKVKRFGTVVNCDLLNVRERPSRNAAILCMLSCDSEIEILDEVGAFYKVLTELDLEGFCMKDYINVRK